MREVLGMDREWGVLAWDVAGKGISYMCLEAAGYLGLVSVLLLLCLRQDPLWANRTKSPTFKDDTTRDK